MDAGWRMSTDRAGMRPEVGLRAGRGTGLRRAAEWWVWFVDIKGLRIHRYEPATGAAWSWLRRRAQPGSPPLSRAAS